MLSDFSLVVTLLCCYGAKVSDTRSNGSLRLVETSDYRAGRVEMFIEPDRWGTICDDNWSNVDAQVVCRQLGFGNIGIAIQRFQPSGSSNAPIWLDEVNCNGHESRLIDCPHAGLQIHDCSHLEDAGVACQGDLPRFPLRLADGNNIGEGRVEIFFDNSWATVCDDIWDNTDASVVCKQLGFSTSGSAVSFAGFGEGSGTILLDSVSCTSNDSNIFDCAHDGFENHDCRHHEDAGVRCRNAPSNIVQLVDGNSHNEGRVEVYYNGEWGTVCDDGWDDTDAGVVCRQLGFGLSGTAIGSAGFGQGSGSIWLDSVTCIGNESTIASCGHLGVGVIRSCNHIKDASVICSGNFNFSINIQPTDGPRKGKVQIYNNEEWGLVCSDGWDSHDATVVCQEKLLGTNGNAIQVAYDNSETLWLSGVKCIGNESQLSFCPHTGIGIVDNCTSVAGVECFGGLPVIRDPPKDQAVVFLFGNKSLTLYCIADGEGLSYTWKRQDLELPHSATGNTTNTLVISGVRERDSGNYRCTVSNKFGTASSGYATLNITVSPPNVTINPNNFIAKVYGSATFLCSAFGIGDFSYKWESSNLIHTNEKSLTISSVLPQDQGQYKCTATSSYSNLTTEAFAILQVKAPSFDSQTAVLHQISSNASTNTITVLIPKADESNGPISHYYIVVSLEQLEDTEAVKESELRPANQAKRNVDLPLYVTASVKYKDFLATFTIGDGSSSPDSNSQRMFYNVPLEKQQIYYYFIRAYSEAHTTEHPFFGTSPLSSPIMVVSPETSAASSSSSSTQPLPAIGGGVVALVIISLIVIIVVIVIKKRHSHAKKAEREFRNEDVTNPAYTGNTETIKGQPECDEHIYDTIDCYDDVDVSKERESRSKASSNIYQNTVKSTNENADCATIKSDQVRFDDSRVYYNKPKPQYKPKHAKKPIALPTAKAPHHFATNKSLPTEDEYMLPDTRYTLESQYASLDETNRAESNQYTSLAVPQHESYETILGQPSPSSTYTVPRNFPTNN